MAEVREFPLIWLQLSGCSGCSVSLLNTRDPDLRNVALDELVPGRHVSIIFHPTVMAGEGEPVMEVIGESELPKEFALVVEGAVPVGAEGLYGAVGETGGREVTMVEKAKLLAERSSAVIAVGTCAAFGGISAASPNPTAAISMSDFMKREGIEKLVVNVPGCPPHPDWMLGTVAAVLLGKLSPEDLDDLHRPLMFYGKLVHENCPRRADFDAGRFAERPGDAGCMYMAGCKGPETYADCWLRMWNAGTNWCIGARSPCHGCVEPCFPDRYSPLYGKITVERLARFALEKKPLRR
jgi:hydrogenase small subunit